MPPPWHRPPTFLGLFGKLPQELLDVVLEHLDFPSAISSTPQTTTSTSSNRRSHDPSSIGAFVKCLTLRPVTALKDGTTPRHNIDSDAASCVDCGPVTQDERDAYRITTDVWDDVIQRCMRCGGMRFAPRRRRQICVDCGDCACFAMPLNLSEVQTEGTWCARCDDVRVHREREGEVGHLVPIRWDEFERLWWTLRPSAINFYLSRKRRKTGLGVP
ncbi:hypothetical protein IWX48DRAFT_591011 [Phyllosticta citricarpa]